MATNVIQGESGLWYLTDPTVPELFIAASSVEEARMMAISVRRCLLTGEQNIPQHTLHDHEAGVRVTVPDPEPMTPEQRSETVARLRDHLFGRPLLVILHKRRRETQMNHLASVFMVALGIGFLIALGGVVARGDRGIGGLIMFMLGIAFLALVLWSRWER